jgi:hypothetical protein
MFKSPHFGHGSLHNFGSFTYEDTFTVPEVRAIVVAEDDHVAASRILLFHPRYPYSIAVMFHMHIPRQIGDLLQRL